MLGNGKCVVYKLPKLNNKFILKSMPSIFIFFWLAILVSILLYGWTFVWEKLLIPTMSPPFADMRTVQGALTSTANGFNPQLENPGDPWQRRMNYPSVWIWIAKALSLQHESNYLIVVFIIICLFLFCCIILLSKY